MESLSGSGPKTRRPVWSSYNSACSKSGHALSDKVSSLWLTWSNFPASCMIVTTFLASPPQVHFFPLFAFQSKQGKQIRDFGFFEHAKPFGTCSLERSQGWKLFVYSSKSVKMLVKFFILLEALNVWTNRVLLLQFKWCEGKAWKIQKVIVESWEILQTFPLAKQQFWRSYSIAWSIYGSGYRQAQDLDTIVETRGLCSSTMNNFRSLKALPKEQPRLLGFPVQEGGAFRWRQSTLGIDSIVLHFEGPPCFRIRKKILAHFSEQNIALKIYFHTRGSLLCKWCKICSPEPGHYSLSPLALAMH